MRERINRLAKGIVDTETVRLVVSPEQVRETVPAGEVVRKELYVTSDRNSNVKGLAYSSSHQVRVVTTSFGGVRNHIFYEVDARNLEHADQIEGSFFLVTNHGEREIPYSFCAEFSGAGQSMGSLQTARDFAAIARDDLQTALRLFDQQDFVRAPFMEDIHLRAVYDGLKGRTNRQNLLEEFLVAAGAKQPVVLEMESESREYEYSDRPIDDVIHVSRDGWGYVCLEIRIDGDFIETIKPVVTDADFQRNRCEINYRIWPGRLHRGKNHGSITLVSPKKSVTVSIVAEGDETIEMTGRRPALPKQELQRYMMLRLDYETGLHPDALLRNQMLQETEQLIRAGGGTLARLLTAELYLMDGRKEQAGRLLEECREQVLEERQDQTELYCFYQYLALQLKGGSEQRESLIRLVRKYLDEGGAKAYLFLLLQRLDPSMGDSPGALLGQMKTLYQEGSSSPFLYLEACRLWAADPGLLRTVDSFELHSLVFAAKKDLIPEELADRIGRLALTARTYHRLYQELLARLYARYPSAQLLEAICCLMIRGDCRRESDFVWYERGIEAGLSLTRLYEYYLYSLPADYGHALPKEVLLYFSYDNDLDQRHRAVLYQNILTYLPENSSIYKEYEREMERFAMNQLFASRIDGSLAVIYHHMIYEDMIDLPVAKVLPAILKSYRIECRNPNMKYVIVRYEELTEETAFLLQDGVAYVPLFSENSVLLFQDSYGNRYADISCIRTRVMNRQELEDRCFQVYPEHPMLRLQQCAGILKAGVAEPSQAGILEHAMEDLRLHELWKKKLLAAIVDFYSTFDRDQTGEDSGEAGDYLIHIDQELLTPGQRQAVCETLIGQNFIREAFEMICAYGIGGIRPVRLLKLCARMILQNLFDQDDLLLSLSRQVFRAGKSDSVVLDYLCEHFNGASSQMYDVLYQAVQERVETYDLEERLLAQMLFSGETEKMDQVFDLYVGRKRTNDTIVKAYFTVKSVEYFVENRPAKPVMFAYLEQALQGIALKEKVPTVYLLALTKYYAGLAGLTKEQQDLCRSIVRILLDENLVFPYLKQLADYASIPDHIMDKVMVQYCGGRDARVEFRVRITPGETEFHREEMRRVYLGIFVKEKVLFEGETMEYQIYEGKDGEFQLKEEGALTCGTAGRRTGENRFSCLNEMGLCLKRKDEDGLKRQMREYLMKNALAQEIFDLL